MPIVVRTPAGRLYLSPAGARTVRVRVDLDDRERLDEMLASGAIQIVTKDP